MAFLNILIQKSWWKDDIYVTRKSSFFEIFRGEEHLLFFNPERKYLATWYWKVLISDLKSCLITPALCNTERWWKYDIYLALESLFLKRDGKMIFFTFYFRDFHGISGLGKYGFCCSDTSGSSQKNNGEVKLKQWWDFTTFLVPSNISPQQVLLLFPVITIYWLTPAEFSLHRLQTTLLP